MEFGGDGARAGEGGREEDSFQLYGHSNDSADLYSINSTSGFREATEELDGLAVENMVLREDFGRLSSFLQRVSGYAVAARKLAAPHKNQREYGVKSERITIHF